MDLKSSSVKKNFAWSSLLTISGFIFPMLTFPYVTRVLGVDGLGNYQFAFSVIQYGSIVSMLGINTVGIREIAKAKGDEKGMTKAFSSLVVLNLVTAVIAILLLILLMWIIPSFGAHRDMLYIGISRILCGALLVEWLYKGIEDFQYITLRAIVVRIIYVISVFIFVRDSNDAINYFSLTMCVTVVNAVINIYHSRKFVRFSLNGICIKPFLKPFVTLGVYQMLTAMYISFNVMFLGSTCGDTEVGYYTTATKLYDIIISIFTAFTGVMLPRMSKLIAEGKNNDFATMTSKSIDFLLLFSMPVIVISEFFAPLIIRIIAGEGYEGSIIPMRIVMPLMLVIGYEQIIIIQMLSPLKKDNAILINSCIGALIALILNITIVPKYAAIGSTVVWCSSELAVLISAQYFISKYTSYQIPIKKIVLNIVLIIPAFVLCLGINSFVSIPFISLIVCSVLVAIYEVIVNIFVIKNELLINIIQKINSLILK